MAIRGGSPLGMLVHWPLRRLLLELFHTTPVPDTPFTDDVDLEWDELELLFEFRNHLLPALENAGFVDYDTENGLFRRGPNFEDVRPVLQLIDDHRDEVPDDWLRGCAAVQHRTIVSFDASEYGQPSGVVLEAVAESTGREQTALPSLQDSIDTDALDTLFSEDHQIPDDICLTFTYAGARVRIDIDGVTVQPRDPASSLRGTIENAEH